MYFVSIKLFLMELSREICKLQNRLGRRESTLFVHTALDAIKGELFAYTPPHAIKGELFAYLLHLKYVDDGKTFVFRAGSRVLSQAFRYNAREWILARAESAATRIDWTKELECLEYFGLAIDGADVVGLGYE